MVLVKPNEMHEIFLGISFGATVSNTQIPIRIGFLDGTNYMEITIQPRQRISTIDTTKHGITEDEINGGTDIIQARKIIIELIKGKTVIGFEPSYILDFFAIPFSIVQGIICLKNKLCHQNENKMLAYKQIAKTIIPTLPNIRKTRFETDIVMKLYKRNKNNWNHDINLEEIERFMKESQKNSKTDTHKTQL